MLNILEDVENIGRARHPTNKTIILRFLYKENKLKNVDLIEDMSMYIFVNWDKNNGKYVENVEKDNHTFKKVNILYTIPR